MPTIQVQLAVTLDDEHVKSFAELLGPALQNAMASTGSGHDDINRIRDSPSTSFAGHEPLEDQSLLIDSRQAARLLKMSPRTLWRMQDSGEMPAPIRFGRAVRWSIDALKKWVDAGCPDLRHER